MLPWATRVRAEEAEDTTAVDEMAAAAKDSTAEASMAGDSAGAAEQTAEAAEAPSANPTCGARHRRAGQDTGTQTGAIGRTRGRVLGSHRTGRQGRARNHLREPCGAVGLMMMVARGPRS